MASYDIFGHISTILSQILLGWKAKLVFGLTSYQTQFTWHNVPNQIFWTKFLPLGLNQIHQTKSIDPNLSNQNYKTDLQN